jgi:hypothetical protein
MIFLGPWMSDGGAGAGAGVEAEAGVGSGGGGGAHVEEGAEALLALALAPATSSPFSARRPMGAPTGAAWPSPTTIAARIPS